MSAERVPTFPLGVWGTPRRVPEGEVLERIQVISDGGAGYLILTSENGQIFDTWVETLEEVEADVRALEVEWNAVGSEAGVVGAAEVLERLRSSFHALEHAEGAPRLDAAWLRLRCDDTLAFVGQLRRDSIRQASAASVSRCSAVAFAIC